MKIPFDCEVSYSPALHLNQIYDGFEKLEKAGVVRLSVKRASGAPSSLLKVLVNNKYRVIYDTLDGLNWIKGSEEENLNYFKHNITADFYFKRSFNQKIVENAPKNCCVFPLGLNYFIKSKGKFSGDWQQKIKDLIKNNAIISKYYNKTNFYSSSFEFYPMPLNESKILFMARLWNPDEVSLDYLKAEREQINKNRIEHIRACRQVYGDNFIGGLRHDAFSMRYAKDLLLPFSLTKKENFLKTIRECNICVATTGLHRSIGWKFGEYVAASRAIVSEALAYQLTGDFEKDKNYLEFTNTTELINSLNALKNDKEKIFEMMTNNFQYYNNYVRPDKLVLNTLLKIGQNE
jgi:hypothetical protein